MPHIPQRSGVNPALRDHGGRIRALERALPSGDVSWAYLNRSSVSVPGDNSQTWISIEDGGPGAFYTNDPGVFSNALHTISGTDYWGLKISEGGTYLFILDGEFPGLAAAARGEIGYDPFDGPGGAVGPAGSDWEPGRRSVIATDSWDDGADNHVFQTNLVAIQGDADSLDSSPVSGNTNVPITYLLFAKQNGGGSPINVRAALVAVRLGSGAFYPGNWV